MTIGYLLGGCSSPCTCVRWSCVCVCVCVCVCAQYVQESPKSATGAINLTFSPLLSRWLSFHVDHARATLTAKAPAGSTHRPPRGGASSSVDAVAAEARADVPQTATDAAAFKVCVGGPARWWCAWHRACLTLVQVQATAQLHAVLLLRLKNNTALSVTSDYLGEPNFVAPLRRARGQKRKVRVPVLVACDEGWCSQCAACVCARRRSSLGSLRLLLLLLRRQGAVAAVAMLVCHRPPARPLYG